MKQYLYRKDALRMTAKKWVTIVTFVCTIEVIIFIVIFKLYCLENNIGYDIGYDIALAVFGSALLGFVMSLVEYFSERKNAMKQF